MPCPKCKRLLQASGVISLEGCRNTLPVYQCDECLMTVDLMGVQTEVAVTFCVDERGRIVDPASPDNELHLTDPSGKPAPDRLGPPDPQGT